MMELVDMPDSKSVPSGIPSTPCPYQYLYEKKKIKINKLDYINPEEVLLRFQDKRNLIFLDSANKTISENNQYSYIAFDPIYTIKFNTTKNYLNSKKFARINKLLPILVKKLNHYQSFSVV